MPTLDYTGSSAAGSFVPESFSAHAHRFVMYRRLKVADIIAADSTMTTNGYIAADDIIQLFHVSNGCCPNDALIRILTAHTASVTIEVGIAGGAELIADNAMDTTAGICYKTITTDSYAHGHIFIAADTIDIQYKGANVVVGDSELFVFGKQLVLGT